MYSLIILRLIDLDNLGSYGSIYNNPLSNKESIKILFLIPFSFK